MKIEVAQDKDVVALRGLYMEMLKELEPFGHDISPTDENVEHGVNMLFLPAARKNEPVMIARDENNRACGAIFWCRTIPDTAFGYGTYVRPEYRGHGLSKDLRDAALGRLKALGVKRLIGSVLPGNEVGRRSLESWGMKPGPTLYTMEI